MNVEIGLRIGNAVPEGVNSDELSEITPELVGDYARDLTANFGSYNATKFRRTEPVEILFANGEKRYFRLGSLHARKNKETDRWEFFINSVQGANSFYPWNLYDEASEISKPMTSLVHFQVRNHFLPHDAELSPIRDPEELKNIYGILKLIDRALTAERVKKLEDNFEMDAERLRTNFEMESEKLRANIESYKDRLQKLSE